MVREAYIKNLCEQLNCTKEDLFKILGQYQIDHSFILLVICCIVLSICIAVVILGVFFFKNGMQFHEMSLWFIILGSFIGLVTFSAGLYNLYNFISFSHNPEMAVMHYIDTHLQIVDY